MDSFHPFWFWWSQCFKRDRNHTDKWSRKKLLLKFKRLIYISGPQISDTCIILNKRVFYVTYEHVLQSTSVNTSSYQQHGTSYICIIQHVKNWKPEQNNNHTNMLLVTKNNVLLILETSSLCYKKNNRNGDMNISCLYQGLFTSMEAHW
jgi:hypothetical protein